MSQFSQNSNFRVPLFSAAAALGISVPFARADTLPVTPPGAQVLWLAADDGVAYDVSGNLTAWFDASDNGHNWVGGDGFLAGGVTVLENQNTEPSSNPANSVPLVSFDGLTPHGLVLDDTSFNGGPNRPLDLTSFSVYVVANSLRLPGDNTDQDFISVYNLGDNKGYAIGTADGDDTNAKFFTGSPGTNINTNNGSFANSQFNLVSAIITPSQAKRLTTGAYGENPVSYTGNGIAFDGGQYVLGNLNGGSQPLLGNIAEILVYDDSGLTDSQIGTQAAEVDSYLDNKYFTAAIPEPASVALASMGMLGLFRGSFSRRRARAGG